MGQADEHRAQQRKHVGLNKSDQQLQAVHEQEHDDAKGVEPQAEPHTHRAPQEDDTGEAQDNRVPRHHVGKETNHQGKWLCKYSYKLNKRN